MTGLRYVLLAVFMSLDPGRKAHKVVFQLQTDRWSYCPGKETLTREASNKLWPTTFYLQDIGFSNRKREKGKNEEKTSSLSVSL